MSYCGPICSIPCGYGYGSGFEGIASCGLAPAYSIGSLSGAGSGIGFLSGSSGSSGLGTSVSSIAQAPSSEIIIQPSPTVVTIPGATLSSSNEPVGVYYNSLCSGGSSGGSSLYSSGLYGGLSRGGRLGYGGWRGYSQRCLQYPVSYGYSCYGPCGPC